MGDLTDAQRAWLKTLAIYVDAGPAGSTAKRPQLMEHVVMSAAPTGGASGGDEPPDDDKPKPARAKDTPTAPGSGTPEGTANPDPDEADKARIKLLKTWEKEKKIQGDSKALRDQLRDKGNKSLQRRARDRFREISEQVSNGRVPDAKPVPTDPDVAMPRGGPKRRLRDWLKLFGLSDSEKYDVGDWLQKKHGEGDLGREIPLDSKKKIPDDPHDHMYTRAEVERLLQEREAELGRKLGNRGKKNGGDGGGGSGGAGGKEGKGDSGKGSGGKGDGGKAGPPQGGGASGASDPHAGTGGAKPPGGAGAGGPAASGPPHAAGSTPPADPLKIDTSKVDAFARKADELLKQSKAPKLDAEKLQKQSVTLDAEAELIAKELQTDPQLKGFSGRRAKEFFAGVRAKYGTVRAGTAGIVVMAFNVADAYALVQEVRSILDSKSLREGLHRSFELGKNVVKGQIQFGALRFVLRSTPVAVGITVFLGDMDMNLGLDAGGLFDKEVAELVNKVRPGSVVPAEHHDNNAIFKDEDAQKLFQEAKAEAIKVLKENMASGLEKYGHGDGLVGAAARAKFEVSKAEKAILSIDGQWLSERYGKGYSRGSSEKANALKRAHDTGFKHGKEGKESKFTALLDWPEIAALWQLEGKATFDFTKTFDAYKNAYEAGYKEGHQTFDTRTITKFKIATGGGGNLVAEKYSMLSLYVGLEYSNGTKGAISEEVEWTTDQPTIASVAFDKGARMIAAHLVGVGKAKISARFASGGKTFEDAISIVVNPPLLKIVPAGGTYPVGFQLQFFARTETWPSVPAGSVVWRSSPPGIVEVDQDGNAVMLKVGEARILVFERETPLYQGSTTIGVIAPQ